MDHEVDLRQVAHVVVVARIDREHDQVPLGERDLPRRRRRGGARIDRSLRQERPLVGAPDLDPPRDAVPAARMGV